MGVDLHNDMKQRLLLGCFGLKSFFPSLVSHFSFHFVLWLKREDGLENIYEISTPLFSLCVSVQSFT